MSLAFGLWICGQLKQRSCPHIHSRYCDFDPVNTHLHRKDKLHFKNGTFCVLTDGSTLYKPNDQTRKAIATRFNRPLTKLL